MIEYDKDLSASNTFGMLSQAKNYCAIRQMSDLNSLVDEVSRHERYWVLGGGSNVILPDVVSGLTIHQQSKGIRILRKTKEATYVQAMGGEVWHDFVQFCIQNDCYGLENLALIPGTVGAAPVQNIGAYGVEVGSWIDEVQVFDPINQALISIASKDCEFAYRDSIFKHQARDLIIMSVVFRFPNTWTPVLTYPDLKRVFEHQDSVSPKEIFDEVIKIRRYKLPDPRVQGNVGSFFKNPIVSESQYQTLMKTYPNLPAYPQPDGRYKLAAGWLIDQAGFKGSALGEVGVHHRQALVLVNLRGQATWQDVMDAVDRIIVQVNALFDVVLEPEPLFV